MKRVTTNGLHQRGDQQMLTAEESAEWGRVWRRLGDCDEGYRAYAADEAVERMRAKRRKAEK